MDFLMLLIWYIIWSICCIFFLGYFLSFFVCGDILICGDVIFGLYVEFFGDLYMFFEWGDGGKGLLGLYLDMMGFEFDFVIL